MADGRVYHNIFAKQSPPHSSVSASTSPLSDSNTIYIMNFVLPLAALALPYAAALEIRGVDLIGALQLPWLEKHCDGCQPDYCYPSGADPDYDCYKKGYPKCCTKDKGNCPNNNKPGCECLPGNCSGNSESDRNKLCMYKDSTCRGTTYCGVSSGSCSGQGRCEEMPVGCTMNLDQVCGCNGITYDNECAANAVGINVDYEGACASNAECKELGETAAEMIVLDNFCAPNYAVPFSIENYDASCRSVAYDECEDNITDVAKRWCPGKAMSSSKLQQLQDMCVNQVNRLID